MVKIFSLIKKQDGAIMVLFALVITVMAGMAALVVDVGSAYAEKQDLQNAIDSAALAGANELPNTTAATAKAKQLMVSNGYLASDITPSFADSNTKIIISSTKIKNNTFAKVIGIATTTVKARAAATSTGVSAAPFNYAVFAGGGPAAFNGAQNVFGGGVYGRDGVSLGNKTKVTGNVVCSSGTINPGNNTTISGDSIPNNPVIAMPDFAALIEAQADPADKYSGNTSLDGKTITGPVYVDGNLTINGRIKGTGIIYVTGTISIVNGSQNPADSIVFYSKGDIVVNGGLKIDIYGILYAPNGQIRSNGSMNGATVNGRVIAKTVDMNGAKQEIIAGTNDLAGLSTIKKIKLSE